MNQFISKDEYPPKMGGLKEIIFALNYCGRGAVFTKSDWNAAYKHVAVQQKQLRYQWFMWLQKYFLELCLIFGCVSSVGLYDRLARLIWMIAAAIEMYPYFLIIQHLDDLIMIGRGDDGRVQKVYQRYLDVCTKTGISLQEPKDAASDKAFGPTTEGSMLGIWFNTVTWKWWLSSDKVLRYANDLTDLLQTEETSQRTIWESVGKILYVSYLIPESKYYTCSLLKTNNQSEDPKARIKITEEMKREIRWWIPMVRLVGEGMPIPPTYNVCPPLALEADNDAARGSKKGAPGCGIVMGDAWAYLE